MLRNSDYRMGNIGSHRLGGLAAKWFVELEGTDSGTSAIVRIICVSSASGQFAVEQGQLHGREGPRTSNCGLSPRRGETVVWPLFRQTKLEMALHVRPLGREHRVHHRIPRASLAPRLVMTDHSILFRA